LDGFDPSAAIDHNSLTKSDRWIRSKTNKFIISSKEHYETFKVFKLISDANQLLDNLSNWYVRRNRRRFWKSENDSDKNAAYSTLYSVLMDFIKVLAPVIPFVCDKIYSNLAVPDKENLKDSIHLCDFPKADESLTDEDILNEVDTVIQIVSLCRSARNKANIKIRQPLAELALYADKNVHQIALNNQEEILEELNIKTLNLVKNESDLVKYMVKPNLPVLGQKYGKEVNFISDYLSKTENEKLIKIIKSDKPLYIQGKNGEMTIFPSELIVEGAAENGYAISTGRNIVVGVSIEISEDLKLEGMVRDLIRQVQNLRKDSGLKVEDRIEIGIQGSKELNDAVKLHKSYFMNEVLGVKLNMRNSESLTFNDSIKINGEKISIGISPT
jgi:isoleucyl-tRNA synthetase